MKCWAPSTVATNVPYGFVVFAGSEEEMSMFGLKAECLCRKYRRTQSEKGGELSVNGVGDFVNVLLDLEKEDKLTDSDMIVDL